VPDRDVFDRSAPRGWASPLRHLCGRSEPDIIAKAATHSLTKTVKSRGGIPGANAVVRLIQEFASGALPLAAALARLQKAERTMGGHLAAAPGINAARRLLFEMCTEPGALRDIPHALASHFCVEIVESNLFGCAPELVGRRFPGVSDLGEFKGAVMGAMLPAIDRVAQQLALDATASTLSLPRRAMRSTRRRTGEILHESLT
jgi:hypothetical protein